MGIVFAAPLWRRGYTTFADLFRERYSSSIERFAILLLIPPSVIWAAAQIRAFGQVLSSATNLEIEAAITTATALVIGYTAVGGLLADAWTDLVQGLTLVTGLLILGVAVLWRMPEQGLNFAVANSRMSLWGSAETAWYEVAESWAIPVFGSVFAIELISRVLACRSAETARRACLLGGGIYLSIGLIPVLIGLWGPQVLPNLSEPEQLIPTLAQLHLGSWFYVLFAGALISAILSTVDSALLSASALISHNMIGSWWPDLTDRQQVRVARFGVVTLGVTAFALALRSNSIYELVETASAFGSAGIAVVTCFALGTRIGGPLAAAGTMAVGMITWGLGESVFHWPAPYLTSIGISIAVYLLLARVETFLPRDDRRLLLSEQET
jgi:Na+/proline symporter